MRMIENTENIESLSVRSFVYKKQSEILQARHLIEEQNKIIKNTEVELIECIEKYEFERKFDSILLSIKNEGRLDKIKSIGLTSRHLHYMWNSCMSIASGVLITSYGRFNVVISEISNEESPKIEFIEENDNA